MRGFTYAELGSHGRLGNQLWQIASTWCISQRERKRVRFPPWPYLEWFNLPPALFGDDLAELENLYPDYLQDLAHIKGFEPDIKWFFYPSVSALTAVADLYPGVSFASKTAVHVRRGDYLQLPQHHPVCPLEYYEAGLEILDPTEMMVFSDDIEWCKKQDLFKDAMFAIGNEVEDLIAMSRCESFVISNSTFSWWAAYLSDQQAERVVYPERWYGPAVDADYTLMVDGLGWNGIEFDKTWGMG